MPLRFVLLLATLTVRIGFTCARWGCSLDPSFPRRRESSFSRHDFWIPAFAGMTIGAKVSLTRESQSCRPKNQLNMLKYPRIIRFNTLVSAFVRRHGFNLRVQRHPIAKREIGAPLDIYANGE